MLYLGHFTFDGERPTHGWFTALAEADSPDEARDKFGNLIESLDDEGFDGFDSVQNIYLEDVTEVERLPEGGVLVRWHEYDGPDPRGTTSTTLPGATDGVASYEWGPDADEDEEWIVEPFYSWGGDDEEDGAHSPGPTP